MAKTSMVQREKHRAKTVQKYAAKRAELRATLGTARMSVRELLALGTGSVVRLNGTPERPVVHHAQIADRLPWLPQSIEEARDTFRRILGPVAAHDEQSNARLLHTLRVFLEQNRSWQAAAGVLHIHKTSLTYRIRRVEELTGRSLSTQISSGSPSAPLVPVSSP